MQVQFAFICREAAEEGDGLLTLRGFPLATVTRSTLPSVLPPSMVLIGLRYGSEDAGLRDITLIGVDPDGRPLFDSVSAREQLPMPDPGETELRGLISPLPTMQLRVFGTHEVRLNIDGEALVTVPFRVRRT